ncbi:MAG: lipid II:glycine glycyltransferase FemX [Sphaerochaetaceae bacterium]
MDAREIPSSQFCSGSHPFQSEFWAKAKKLNSWVPHFLEIDLDSRKVQLLVLARSFLRGMFTLAYVPMGPEIGLAKDGAMGDIAKAVAKALDKSVFAIRFDFPFDYQDVLGQFSWQEEELEKWYSAWALSQGLVLLDQSIQPQGTVMMDLGAPFEYRTRARRILKKNSGAVTVDFWDGSEGDFDQWYEIYRETAHNDGFTARSRKYMQTLLELSGEGGVKCRLILARFGSEIQGGIMVISSKDEETYLFGGARRSSDFNVSYCLQDFAIKDAKAAGMRYYDFYGSHGTMGRSEHLAKLTQFKLAFGGRQIFRIPSCDYVMKKSIWKMYRHLESKRLERSRD